jgi:hypothetical protein
VGGLISHLVKGGVFSTILLTTQFLFMKHDLKKALNMKLILCNFVQLYVLKINFHKTQIFGFEMLKMKNNIHANFWV